MAVAPRIQAVAARSLFGKIFLEWRVKIWWRSWHFACTIRTNWSMTRDIASMPWRSVFWFCRLFFCSCFGFSFSKVYLLFFFGFYFFFTGTFSMVNDKWQIVLDGRASVLVMHHYDSLTVSVRPLNGNTDLRANYTGAMDTPSIYIGEWIGQISRILISQGWYQMEIKIW